MKTVVTVNAHRNPYGQSFLKLKGDKYDHPNPEADIKAGFIKMDKNDVQNGAKGRQGDGRSSISAKGSDGQKSD